MKKMFLLATLFAISITACKKQTATSHCKGCNLIGIYTGLFHDVGGCYSCIPYTDTTYPGSFVVDTLPLDSIKISRDNYEWRLAYNDTGKYSRGGCCTIGESLEFKLLDTLTYSYSNGGSGGYFRQDFTGKKQ